MDLSKRLPSDMEDTLQFRFNVPFVVGRHLLATFLLPAASLSALTKETSELFHPRAKEHKQGKKNCKKTCIFHIIVSFAKQQQRTKAQNQKTRVFLVYSLYETTICSSVNHILAALAVSLLIHFSICGT